MESQIVADINRELRAVASEQHSEVLSRYMQVKPGGYGEGDAFLGVRNPQIWEIARKNKGATEGDILELIHSHWHEERACGYYLLAKQYHKNPDATLQIYLRNTEGCNNWDLVDGSAPKILGEWLCSEDHSEEEKFGTLDRLASSAILWEQRIAIVSTLTPLKHGLPQYTLCYAERFLRHPHDLMHKATGWMLREMGKNVSMDLLRSFLDQHYNEMPRTMLRYAIEKMDEGERRDWLDRK